MKFERDKFFAGMRNWGMLSQAQVDGLNALLDGFEADDKMNDRRWVAYALATVKHETADTYRPIAEYGKGKGKPYGHKDPETGQTYYGRGYVQLTWRRNYEQMSELVGVNLVDEPHLAMESDIAYKVMSVGMRGGIFTGKKLSDYIHGESCDYLHARRIINAMDKAQLIAGYAGRFETILKAATESALEAPPKEAIKDVETVSPPSQQTVESGGAATQVVVGGEAAKPVVSEKDTPPVQASTGGLKSMWATITTGAAAIPTAIWGVLQGNAELIKWALIVGGGLAAIYLLRQVIMDVVRMWTRADPQKYNVK